MKFLKSIVYIDFPRLATKITVVVGQKEISQKLPDKIKPIPALAALQVIVKIYLFIYLKNQTILNKQRGGSDVATRGTKLQRNRSHSAEAMNKVTDDNQVTVPLRSATPGEVI